MTEKPSNERTPEYAPRQDLHLNEWVTEGMPLFTTSTPTTPTKWYFRNAPNLRRRFERTMNGLYESAERTGKEQFLELLKDAHFLPTPEDCPRDILPEGNTESWIYSSQTEYHSVREHILAGILTEKISIEEAEELAKQTRQWGIDIDRAQKNNAITGKTIKGAIAGGLFGGTLGATAGSDSTALYALAGAILGGVIGYKTGTEQPHTENDAFQERETIRTRIEQTLEQKVGTINDLETALANRTLKPSREAEDW